MSLYVYLKDPTSTYDTEYIYDRNITHNLNTMAEEAGMYKALWRPEEIDAKYAKDIIEIVDIGLKDLLARPEHFKSFNPENGWGDYDGLVEFTEEYLDKLKEFPEAIIEISR